MQARKDYYSLALCVAVRVVNKRLLSQKDSGFRGSHPLRQVLRVKFEKCGFVFTLPVWELQVMVDGDGQPLTASCAERAVRRLHKRPTP
jgi:hypothetical protein